MPKEHDAQGRVIHHGPYPELTWHAIIVGWFLGAIIALSIGYAALILGFSIEGSELAAILGWGILRGMMRRTSIVENNINQTIASAVNGASAGMMFSVPALFILARQNPDQYGDVTGFSPVLMVLACITGGILGLAFIIPLRKQMIDFNRLAYPGGIAVATILKSPGAGLRKAGLLIGGAVVSATVYLIAMSIFGDHPEAHVGKRLGLPSWLNLTFFLSLMTIGVGFLSGKGGMVFGYGGFICYWLLAPMLVNWGAPEVKEKFEPAARQAIVDQENARAVRTAAQRLEEFNPTLAERLKAATGFDTILEIQTSDPDPENTRSERLQAFLSDKRLFNVEVAELIQDAVAALEAEAERIKPADAEADPDAVVQASLLHTAAEELKKKTRVEDILTVASEVDGPQHSAFRAALAEGSAYDVHEAIQAPGAFDADTAAKLNKVTEAESKIDHVPDDLRLSLFRPTGIGMLIGAAIGGIIAAFPLVRSAVRSMQQAAKEKGGAFSADELPISLLYAAIILGAIAMIVIAHASVPNMTWTRAVPMALLGTLWIWIAGVIVSECLGRTNWSPLSGMTLIAVTILILIASKHGTTSGIIASVMVGAAVCVAIAQAGDMMLDLKSGYLVGARPKMQQIGQLLGTWLGPILIIVLIFVLDRDKGLGSDQLPAPQGQALASVINGLIGGDVPTWRYLAGGGLGLMLAFSGLGGIGVLIGLGFYMPFAIVLTYTIGCLTRIIVEKYKGLSWVQNVGIPIAAGLIVGEALVGVGNAFYQILFKA